MEFSYTPGAPVLQTIMTADGAGLVAPLISKQSDQHAEIFSQARADEQATKFVSLANGQFAPDTLNPVLYKTNDSNVNSSPQPQFLKLNTT